MPGFKELIVWQKSMDLVERIYRISARFPENERFGLTSQIRRAAVSIPSNIAEGHGRESDGDFSRFLSIANGSPREVETQLFLAERLEYANREETGRAAQMCTEVAKLIGGFKRHLAGRNRKTDD